MQANNSARLHRRYMRRHYRFATSIGNERRVRV
jgi:hypothetical protein